MAPMEQLRSLRSHVLLHAYNHFPASEWEVSQLSASLYLCFTIQAFSDCGIKLIYHFFKYKFQINRLLLPGEDCMVRFHSRKMLKLKWKEIAHCIYSRMKVSGQIACFADFPCKTRLVSSIEARWGKTKRGRFIALPRLMKKEKLRNYSI